MSDYLTFTDDLLQEQYDDNTKMAASLRAANAMVSRLKTEKRVEHTKRNNEAELLRKRLHAESRKRAALQEEVGIERARREAVEQELGEERANNKRRALVLEQKRASNKRRALVLEQKVTVGCT
jgi:hypothetical protein